MQANEQVKKVEENRQQTNKENKQQANEQEMNQEMERID